MAAASNHHGAFGRLLIFVLVFPWLGKTGPKPVASAVDSWYPRSLLTVATSNLGGVTRSGTFSHIPPNSREWRCFGYAKFEFTIDAGKGPLHPCITPDS